MRSQISVPIKSCDMDSLILRTFWSGVPARPSSASQPSPSNSAKPCRARLLTPGSMGGSPSARRPPALMCLLTLTTLVTSSATCPASTSCRAGPAPREGACVSLKSPTRCMSALERWGRLPMPEVAIRRTLRPRRQILDTAPGRVLVRHQGQGRRHDQAGRREGLHHALGQAHHRLVGGLLLLGEQPRVTVRLGASRSVVPIEPEAPPRLSMTIGLPRAC